MIFRISIFLNAVLCLVFISLGLITIFNTTGPIKSASVFVFVFLFFAFGVFLFFDHICYRTLSLNKEKSTLSGGMKNYGIVIFSLGIVALLIVLFISIAVAYVIFAEAVSFPKRQWPFYFLFLLSLILTAVSFILNAVGYFRSLKENKNILHDYINDIGSSL